MNIEVEDKELLIENDNGTIAIIPKEKSAWVKKKIEEGCFDCIDNFISTLPAYSTPIKAQNGVKVPLNAGVLPGVTIIGQKIPTALNLSVDDKAYLKGDELSKFTPTKAKDKEAVYYNIDLSNLPDELNNMDYGTLESIGARRIPITFKDGKEYITDFGYDEQSNPYISFYRKDGGFLSDLFGNSKEYYNRIYLNDKKEKYYLKGLNPKEIDEYLEAVREKKKPEVYFGGYNYTKDYIPLTQGRYNTGKLPKEMLDEFYEIAKKEGVDIYDLLSVAGRETTFEGYGLNRDTKTDIISGWNLANDYIPKTFADYLADKKLPFIKTKRTFDGYVNTVTNENKYLEYIKDNPLVVLDYLDYVREVPEPSYGKYNPYVELARMIKNKQMHKYNPGDPDYQNKLAKEKELLLKEKGIKEYLKNKENELLNIKMEMSPVEKKQYGDRITHKLAAETPNGIDWFVFPTVDIKNGKWVKRK